MIPVSLVGSVDRFVISRTEVSVLRYGCSEAVWKAAGATYFLVVAPMHVFDLSIGDFDRWRRPQVLAKNPRQRWDILFLHDYAWHYYGTYECVGSTAVFAEELQKRVSRRVRGTICSSSVASLTYVPCVTDFDLRKDSHDYRLRQR